MYPTALLPPSSTRKARMSVAAVTIENNIPRELESNRAFRPTCARQRANSQLILPSQCNQSEQQVPWDKDCNAQSRSQASSLIPRPGNETAGLGMRLPYINAVHTKASFPGSPLRNVNMHLHNFNARVLEWGSLGMRLRIMDLWILNWYITLTNPC